MEGPPRPLHTYQAIGAPRSVEGVPRLPNGRCRSFKELLCFPEQRGCAEAVEDRPRRLEWAASV